MGEEAITGVAMGERSGMRSVVNASRGRRDHLHSPPSLNEIYPDKRLRNRTEVAASWRVRARAQGRAMAMQGVYLTAPHTQARGGIRQIASSRLQHSL